MAKRNSCSFEDSILGRLGWTQDDFEKIYINQLGMKMSKNIKLSPQEMKDYIAMTEAKKIELPTYKELQEECDTLRKKLKSLQE